MIPPPSHLHLSPPHADALNDPQRLLALRQTALLDSAPEELFDLFTRLAIRTLRVPVALVSLVDSHRQFFKSAAGLPEPWAHVRETPLTHSFCQYAVATREPLIVEDARLHPLVQSNKAVTDIGVVAYAGIPLITHDGYAIGSFCAIDANPRIWTQEEIEILRDLAQGVMAEIEWRRSVNAAVRSSIAKDNFIAVLSHELRTPLNPALLTATAMATDPVLPDAFREDARLIQRCIELETRLIDDLLDSTRIASGKLQLQLECTDIHFVLKNSVAICIADARAKDVHLHLDLRATHHAVQGDSTRLQQVFWNILKNAIKFTPAHGSISVRTTSDEQQTLSVSIIDTGIGVPPDVLPRMFNAFEQGEANREYGGMGLGLAICKGIVDAHGGTISATSAGTHKGTTITVTLTAATVMERETASPRAAPPARPARATQELKILLVEDHVDTLHAMTRLLRKMSYDVTTANCVAAALVAATSASFDIIISDVGLPDGTGLDLIRQLATIQPVRGIALTGYGMESDVEEAMKAGFSRHLTKPINFGQLHRTIQELANSDVTAGSPSSLPV